jgi:hypothetical protein
MAEPIPIFHGSSGINTKLDPTRLRFSAENGISELAAAVNVIIDDSGRLSRRNGFTATDRTETWKNLFGCKSYGIGTKGDALCIIEPNMAYTAIRNITPYARMSYVRDTDGTQDVIYYCNGYENGRIISKVSHSWPVATYSGAPTLKNFSAAPLGHLLEIRNSRMFIAEDNFLWYSEPGNYSLYRLAVSFFGFQNRLRMIQAVDGGLWVSDEEAIYFLGGEIIPTAPEMPKQIKKADYPALGGSAIKVSSGLIGIDGLSGIVIVFATSEGICVGSAGGDLINITEKKIDLPSALSGSGYYKDGHYIMCID